MQKIEAYEIEEIYTRLIMGGAQEVITGGRTFIIGNNGTHPLYINLKITATMLNGFVVPGNTNLPIPLTCDRFSIISDPTGSYLTLMYLR